MGKQAGPSSGREGGVWALLLNTEQRIRDETLPVCEDSKVSLSVPDSIKARRVRRGKNDAPLLGSFTFTIQINTWATVT